MLLPTELLGTIVNTLALPTHPQAYGFEADVQHSLVHLCSASTTLYSIASPYLYSSVIIASSHQLHSFVNTLCNTKGRLSPALHSLSLRDFDDALEETCVTDFIGLLVVLHKYSPNFRRLIIDRDLRTWLDPVDYISDSSSEEENPETKEIGPTSIAARRLTIRSGLDALQSLEELSSIQDEIFLPSFKTDGTWEYNSGWKYHLQLRYLSLYNPIIDSDFARDIIPLHFLKCLVLVRPDVTDDTAAQFFRAIMARSRLLLVGPMPINHIKDILATAQPTCEIFYVEAPAEERDCIRHVQLWARQQLERGTLFEGKATRIWPRHEEDISI